jgi:hypothetical protein
MRAQIDAHHLQNQGVSLFARSPRSSIVSLKESFAQESVGEGSFGDHIEVEIVEEEVKSDVSEVEDEESWRSLCCQDGIWSKWIVERCTDEE